MNEVRDREAAQARRPGSGDKGTRRGKSPCPLVSASSILILAALLLAGCSVPAEELEGAVVIAPDGAAEVTIGSDDQMRFYPRRFTVSSGQMVRLTLRHDGRLPLEQMGHNVVILQQGEDPVRFGREAQRGGNIENHWVPQPLRGRVIAFTAMIGGGQSDSIEFTAPDPGEYPFVCTFPGHFSVMRGVMVAE